MAGDDFVMVQLSKDGIQEAKGAPLRISNGRRSFLFMPGAALRVERSYEWNAILKLHVTPDGRSLFELAPDAASTKPSAAPAPVATNRPEAAGTEEKK